MISELNNALTPLKVHERLAFVAERFAGKVVFASSLGAEDQVITDLIARYGYQIPIITLDTGRLFPEAYDLIAETEARYNLKIQVYTPDRKALETFVNTHGVNAFRQSEELRHECCRIRKIGALRRALAGKDLWVCGLRHSQSVTRTNLHVVEDDAANGLLKLSPLLEWEEQRVWDYIKFHDVPYNPLHDKGFPSIGCACCTRAIRRTEDIRAGRWWWEIPEHRECGLHRPVPPEER